MNKEKFQEVKRDLANLLRLSDDHAVTENNREKVDDLIIDTAVDLLDAYHEGEKKSEMLCNCHCDNCDANAEEDDDESDGIAYACIRTAQIKNIDFSDDGVTTINMRHGEPIIFKDILEVMFIS